MSLVGSLEDLGLGDILQIVSLSRKSGLLLLRSEAHRGRILMIDGQVRGAAIEGEDSDPQAVLVDAGFVTADDFKRAVDAAASGGIPVEQAVAERAGMPVEDIALLLCEQVEQAVLEMLGWRTGEFSFEVRESDAPGDAPLLLKAGINAQYFAMEATRLGDERCRRERSAPAVVVPGEPVFSGDPARNAKPPAEAVADRAPVQRTQSSEPMLRDAGADGPCPQRDVALIAIDRNLALLEWLKQGLEGMFSHIHIFQDDDCGVARIRQYLARSRRPLVLLGDAGGEQAARVALARRLRAQAAGMPVLLLSEPREAAVPGEVSGVLERPRPSQLAAGPDAARELRRQLMPWLERSSRTRPRSAAAIPVLEELKHISRRLRDPSTRGEVTTLVLDFAARSFSRVAIFMVRDAMAIGMAQRGMPAAGGPDDEGLRRLRIPLSGPGCFRRVVGQRASYRGAPGDAGDRMLVELLGDCAPPEFYLAPIESGGGVAALLYADNLPQAQPLVDATALEIALQEAGLALDRALLERALAELESRKDGA